MLVMFVAVVVVAHLFPPKRTCQRRDAVEQYLIEQERGPLPGDEEVHDG